MSKLEIDDLFRKKLEGHNAIPPPHAWEKIESNLHPDKVSWRYYLAIAASIIIIGIVAVYMFIPGGSEEYLLSGNELMSKDSTVIDEVQESELVTPMVASEQLAQAEIAPTKSVQTSKVFEPITSKNKVVLADSNNEGQLQPGTDSNEDNFNIQLLRADGLENVQNQSLEMPVQLTAQVIEIEKAPADPGNERGLSLKKVIELAKDLKTDNTGWSDLRAAKNDFLSLGRKKNEDSQE